MNIATILTLDDGVSGIECSGIVTYVKPAAHKVSTNPNKPYDFWTQFVIIKDATGDIGVNLNLGAEGYLAVEKGKRIAVEKGLVQSYTDNKGNLRKSLRANLVMPGEPVQGGPPAPPKAQQGPQQARQSTNAPKPDQFPLSSIERQVAAKAACERFAGYMDITDEAILEFAQKIAYFIETGLIFADKQRIQQEQDQIAADLAEEPVDEPQQEDYGTP